MNRRETGLLERIHMPVRSGDLRAATDVLRATREMLAHPDVQRLLGTALPEATPAEGVEE
jgi:hypothetical protein